MFTHNASINPGLYRWALLLLVIGCSYKRCHNGHPTRLPHTFSDLSLGADSKNSATGLTGFRPHSVTYGLGNSRFPKESSFMKRG